jgi:hypothetical protein
MNCSKKIYFKKEYSKDNAVETMQRIYRYRENMRQERRGLHAITDMLSI